MSQHPSWPPAGETNIRSGRTHITIIKTDKRHPTIIVNRLPNEKPVTFKKKKK